MLQEPFQDPQPEDGEPDGSGPAEESDAPWPDDPQGPQQGLFVCLPPEDLSLAGFAQNGQADTMAPGALLGTVLHAVVGEGGSGLPGLSDDQLIGVLSGSRRLEAWTAWIQLAAMRELARRRPAVEPGDTGRAGFSDFAADQMMAEFHMTWESATGQIMYACTVADRLPNTFAALEAGRIHPVAVKIIQKRPDSCHPSRKLNHLIRARSTTCTAPGCNQPAARCDLDHTTAWDKGGLTCECNLAPQCKR